MKKPLSKRRVQVVASRDFQNDEEQRMSSPFYAQKPRRDQSVGCRRLMVMKQLMVFIVANPSADTKRHHAKARRITLTDCCESPWMERLVGNNCHLALILK